ncbi:MAG: 3-dehydroquinate synthase family protein, partial [Alphaproteobacteria bacterium]
QPRLVLADTATLATLPRRELVAGYAEVVKYALIGDADFFAWLEADGEGLLAGDSRALRHAVLTCCGAKARIVAADEREGGARALLNLGHTFAHALEAESGFGAGLLHGEAVAIGMVLAFDLSVQLGLCPGADAVRLRRHLAHAGLPVGPDEIAGRSWDVDALMGHMARDKKVRDGRITFVLARGLGNAFVAGDVDPADAAAVLRDAITG